MDWTPGLPTPTASLDSAKGPVATEVSGSKSLFCCGFQQVAGGCPLGWLPKKMALSLAILRASPASIRKSPGRNQEFNEIGFPLSPVRSPVHPKKLSPPSHSVNCLPFAFRTVWTPIQMPLWTPGATKASTSASDSRQFVSRTTLSIWISYASGLEMSCLLMSHGKMPHAGSGA